MKKLILIIVCSVLIFPLAAQSEFKVHKNGLIYSIETMSKLTKIVDSLNLKYKVCDFNKVFKSKSQTKAAIVYMDSGNIKEAKKDMDSNISMAEFIEKYPKSKITNEVLVVKFEYNNYNGEPVVEYSQVAMRGYRGFNVLEVNEKKPFSEKSNGKWLYEYDSKSKYSKESLKAFYFTENFKSEDLPIKYSRKIGYSDCLIDTSSTKFKSETEPGYVALPKNWQKLPLKKQQGLLDEMRSTHVMGMCSMDSRPREHAVNIALLSAETTNWEVFLKSHLDIMNDRFDRMSDGSYAWASRKTYIKELEEIDINVLDLLIGISLRVENPATNHYYGSIGRLGRAISESTNRKAFESEMLSMIENSELDDYNRVIAYFLFVNYNSYLENDEEKKENLKLLKESIELMPSYLSEKINLEE